MSVKNYWNIPPPKVVHASIEVELIYICKEQKQCQKICIL